ncbi:universal stress protein [Nonomuraea phyllanthi]|uniref:universal stress protein n=1 Tax=Nonomuraea phyllanthi TaxID=2219224 RepID=UPI001292F99F|nr:universal stress protein [Nonomuraea phyllanthi]QFY07993.1 universal stress protein [Nonomuraea phyllanthi]
MSAGFGTEAGAAGAGERPVVVGYDESPGSEQALRWAAEEARLRGLPLVVCHAWHWPYTRRPVDKEVLARLEATATAVVEGGTHRARELAPTVNVRSLLAKGVASAVLLQAVRNAELGVLGSRGQGGFEELRVGSAAVQVPAHSVEPVIVVGPDGVSAGESRPRIVVGVDGSPAGQRALEFAFEEARLRAAPVTVVCCWEDAGDLSGQDGLPFVDRRALRANAEASFRNAVSQLTCRYPAVPVMSEFIAGRPERTVIDAAQEATLLVLGSRGVGSTPSVLLGRVTQTALAEAVCPVAVTPPRT